MSSIDLSLKIFSDIANTHKTVITNNSTDVKVKYNSISYVQEYNNETIEIYPIELKPVFDDGVYCTDSQYIFLAKLFKYLPKDTVVKHAYIPPNIQAKIGLELLNEINPTFDFDIIVGNKTNPELVGKYKDYFLHEFDYSLLQNILSTKNIIWANINKSNHQKGLEIDLYSPKYQTLLVELIKYFVDNSLIEGLKSYLIDENGIHLQLTQEYLFKSLDVSSKQIINSGANNNISDCINNTSQKNIYQILKKHGYGDLKDNPTFSPSQLSRMPTNIKNRGTALSKAINESLQEVLGGSNGVLSNYQQNTNEYLLSMLRGALSAISQLAIELNTSTEGRASRIVLEAFESECLKSPTKESIINSLLSSSSLDKNDMASFISEITPAKKIEDKKTELSSINNNENIKNDVSNTESDVHSEIYKKYNFIEQTVLSKATKLTYTQTIASPKWTIAHNFQNKTPVYSIVDDNGNKVNASLGKETTDNVLVLDFSYPVKGVVTIYE